MADVVDTTVGDEFVDDGDFHKPPSLSDHDDIPPLEVPVKHDTDPNLHNQADMSWDVEGGGPPGWTKIKYSSKGVPVSSFRVQ